MSRYLVAVSIGPVQEFIAAARRTRDLWMGSALLSELAKAAAKAAHERGAELIFPAPRNPADLEPGSGLCVANKLLFAVETDTPSEIVAGMRAEVGEALRRLAAEATGLGAGKKLRFDEQGMQGQLDRLMEFFAAWIEWPVGVAYQGRRVQLDRLLAARKGLRDFRQHQGSARPKNTIDGIREDVINEESRQHYHGRELKAGERLDAIGVVKRFGRIAGDGGGLYAPQFDSTQDLAAVPYARVLLGLADTDAGVAANLQRYVALVGAAGPRSFFGAFRPASLGELLAPEKNRVPGKGKTAEPEEDPELTAVRRTLHRVAPPPRPYYALLLADGDHMGQALDQCKTEEQHRQFSERLAGFALHAREAVERECDGLRSGLGTVIYAGGDDLLAFAPLDTALRAAKAVNQAFHASGLKHPATLSAALVIAHAQEDLAGVIEQAHETLNKEAKQNYGHNALAITVLRRSGAPLTLGGHWDVFPQQLSDLGDAYAQGKVPFGLGYEWRVLVGRCCAAGLDGGPNGALARPLAQVVLEKKGDSAQSHLGELAGKIANFKELQHLADLLVLAKAMNPGVHEREMAAEGSLR